MKEFVDAWEGSFLLRLSFYRGIYTRRPSYIFDSKGKQAIFIVRQTFPFDGDVYICEFWGPAVCGILRRVRGGKGACFI